MELFVAGQETTSSTLKFVEELDREVGDNEQGTKRISLADKAKLPYTNAVINETQRFCNLLPTNLLHRTTKEVEIAGFHIAKGTQIVPVISTVLYDEKIFPQPHKFMPERFIQNGQLKKCEELIPFSIGRRQCMGESLARAELFLFTANLFYMYKISAVDPSHLPSLSKNPGLTVSPVDYNCRLERRKQQLIS
uniref:Cytochrome P450 n=1 Tax=Ditylenchus dipsaci TaxID=166011 RepID=A0A915E4P5_9BILA